MTRQVYAVFLQISSTDDGAPQQRLGVPRQPKSPPPPAGAECPPHSLSRPSWGRHSPGTGSFCPRQPSGWLGPAPASPPLDLGTCTLRTSEKQRRLFSCPAYPWRRAPPNSDPETCCSQPLPQISKDHGLKKGGQNTSLQLSLTPPPGFSSLTSQKPWESKKKREREKVSHLMKQPKK